MDTLSLAKQFVSYLEDYFNDKVRNLNDGFHQTRLEQAWLSLKESVEGGKESV